VGASGAGAEPGGRHRRADRRAGGYEFRHSARDDHSRVADTEILTDERATTCAACWGRAAAFLATHGIPAHRVLTDNGSGYRSRDVAPALAATTPTHRRTRPSHLQTHGTVERYHRTFLDEWACVRLYRSRTARAHALPRWLHTDNHQRARTALGGLAPLARVTNLPGQHP